MGFELTGEIEEENSEKRKEIYSFVGRTEGIRDRFGIVDKSWRYK